MPRLILVTGGTGYVGSALVPRLALRYPVRVYCTMDFGNPIEGTPGVEFVKGDMRDADGLGRAVQGVTDVVHLAGVVTDDLVAMNPALAKKINVDATLALCWLAQEARTVRRMVYASSSSIYGTTDGPATELTPPRPMTDYAQTKLDAERIMLAHSTPQMPVVALRSATCMGPAPRMRLDTIVNVFSAQAWFEGVIHVHGGGQWRSNVHVRDAVDAYILALDAPVNKVAGEVFNVTGGNATATDIAQVVQAARNLSKDRPMCVLDIQRDKVDNRHYQMDAGKIRDAMGWRPTRSVREAAMDNFQWFQQGHVPDWKSDLYYNTRRMAAQMKGEA